MQWSSLDSQHWYNLLLFWSLLLLFALWIFGVWLFLLFFTCCFRMFRLTCFSAPCIYCLLGGVLLFTPFYRHKGLSVLYFVWEIEGAYNIYLLYQLLVEVLRNDSLLYTKSNRTLEIPRSNELNPTQCHGSRERQWPVHRSAIHLQESRDPLPKPMHPA